jgi:hypothetical protein
MPSSFGAAFAGMAPTTTATRRARTKCRRDVARVRRTGAFGDKLISHRGGNPVRNSSVSILIMIARSVYRPLAGKSPVTKLPQYAPQHSSPIRMRRPEQPNQLCRQSRKELQGRLCQAPGEIHRCLAQAPLQFSKFVAARRFLVNTPERTAYNSRIDSNGMSGSRLCAWSHSALKSLDWYLWPESQSTVTMV